MPSPARPSPSSSRKFVWLAAAILAGGLLWTTGWYYFAARFEDNLPAALARIVGPDASADCATADVRGYPFRFGLFCETLSYANPAEGMTANTGALRSAAQFYRPGHVVAEVDGPLVYTDTGLAVRTDWQVLQASVRAVSDGLDRGSIDARNISFDIDGAGLAQRFALQADRVNAHARRNAADLDIAAYGDNLRNSLVDGLAAKAFTLEATLTGRANMLEVPVVPLTTPFDAVLHRVAIELDENTSLEIAGPVHVDDNRRITANLELTVRNLQQLLKVVEPFNPEVAGLLAGVGPLIASLDTKPGDDAITLPLKISNNMVSLGMFPLGELPSL